MKTPMTILNTKKPASQNFYADYHEFKTRNMITKMKRKREKESKTKEKSETLLSSSERARRKKRKEEDDFVSSFLA